MTILKRASSKIEDKILRKTKEINDEYQINTDADLKVYLRLKRDGSLLLNQKGQVGMTLLSDREILQKITSGHIFSIEDDV